MQEMVLRTRLLAYAEWAAASNGFVFDDAARGPIGAGVERAVAEIVRLAPRDAPETTEQLSRIAEAEGSIKRLVGVMIRGKVRRPGFTDAAPNRIDAESLQFALGELCPIWPFC